MLVFDMKTHRKLYERMISAGNLTLAWRRARRNKTSKPYVIEFERNLEKNLVELHLELKNKSYVPRPLQTFVLRDPKTRKISKSHFRDRIVHHAVCLILEPIYDKIFITDCCANRKGKGTIYALKRFDKFKRKVSKNGTKIGTISNNDVRGYCLKADITHYFEEVNHEILLKILAKKINDADAMWLIKQIVKNSPYGDKKGMPLGNLTSQFFANIYLNELDYFVKHKLKVKFHIRYVDDFMILDESKEKLFELKEQINNFLKTNLKIELHPQKSRIIPLLKGVDFVGFRNFYHYRLLRKRNVRSMEQKLKFFREDGIRFGSVFDSYKGWQAYAKWGNTYKVRKKVKREIIDSVWNRV